MPNIVKELSLNKHPKDCKDLSLINARNIVVSNDFSCLQNELSITNHYKLTRYLENKVLVGYIPCNKEVVLFACLKEDYDELIENHDSSIDCIITRYNEDRDEQMECLTNFQYYGGKLVGTFTYNVQNNLIIAVGESDPVVDVKVPLRTINLGKFNEITKGTDRDLNEGLHAVSPELILPKISDFAYVPGTTYKGWYYFFIRYKINNVDYTHWFPIGYPIFICDIEKQTIFKYGFKYRDSTKYNITGAVDYFSSKSNISNETIELNLIDFDDERYNYYQIGFICVSKDSSKAFRTNDIQINVNNYILSITEANSYSVNDLILDNYNYYNVKNVINYQNRLYISNFKENSNPIISEANLSKIKLTYEQEEISVDDFAYQNIYVDNEDSEPGEVNNVISIEKLNTVIEDEDYEFIEPYPYYNGTIIQSLKIGNSINLSSLDYGEYSEIGNIYTNENNPIRANLNIKVNRGGKHGPRYKLIFITIESIIRGKTYKALYKSTANSGGICGCYYNDFEYEIILNGNSDINTDSAVFINTNNSFNKRKKDSTLIPGEIYSFYIHFVNKYGEATDGYKIPNEIGRNDIQYITHNISPNGFIDFPINQKVFDDEGNIYFSGSEYIYNLDNISDEQINNYLKYALEYVKNIPNVKWYQILSGYIRLNPDNAFIPFINNNGDILYKVPFTDFYFNGSTCTYYNYKLKFNLDDFVLPDGYIGYYFSYEKFEPTIKFRGLLSKKDISIQEELDADNENQVPYNNYNKTDIQKLDYIHFYSSNLDINEQLELDFNVLQVIKTMSLYESSASYEDNEQIEFANAKFPANLNKPEYSGSFINSFCSINKYSLSIAGDSLKDKTNLGTSLEITLTDKIKNLFDEDNFIFKANLVKITTNIYTNENKILIKFTDIYYDKTEDFITRGLNGHITYNNFIVYDFNKFVFNTQNNTILNEKYGMYYKSDVFDIENYDNDNNDYVAKYIDEYRAPLYYAQLFTYDTIFNEAKSFKNEPSIYYLQLEKTLEDVADQIKQFAENIIPIPQNTVDLFENKYPTQDALNPKTFVNYDANKSYLETYDKRVRRSNVIADESNENSWRIFPLEGYKDITENKGKITNLVGVGTTLLVHTEHSLFMFDRSNTLQTADKEVQLAMPDIFDVDYKEVFTSELGVCGLQDRDAYIVDQFGYIFYDNDAHRLYKFGQGKIDNIDLDIVQFLNKYKPYQIRFAHDKEANRILVNIRFTNKEVTLSYNYMIAKWISFHDYVFDAAFNTKQMLYLLINRKNDINYIATNIYTINDLRNYKDNTNSIQNIKYNYFENIREELDEIQPVDSQIDIICNSKYDEIKYLEYIAYKLYKVEIDESDYSPTPVEELKLPYSGHELRIFNTEVDTNSIDILIDNVTPETQKNSSIMAYKKPWWELGNWNFNYLRDKKQGNVKFPSRLYGNYFIVSFKLFDEIRRIEFETLDYQATKDTY